MSASWKPDVCVYHGNCDDGFGAAWAIWSRWPAIDFIPAVYGKPVFSTRHQFAGKELLFVDFSLPHDQMRELALPEFDMPGARTVVVLDHHKTAQEALRPFVWGQPFGTSDIEGLRDYWQFHQMLPIVAQFDMQKSGAHLAWEFAHPDKPVPEFIAYIEDRDLWRFALDGTKEFSAALRTYPLDFATWDQLQVYPHRLIEDGRPILRAHQANIEKFIGDAYTETIGGHEVPCVNVPYHYASDVADALLAKFPDAPFAACWFRRGDKMFQASLRSQDHRIDVSEIAKKYGGGGHRNAAGFQVGSLNDRP